MQVSCLVISERGEEGVEGRGGRKKEEIIIGGKCTFPFPIPSSPYSPSRYGSPSEELFTHL